MGEILGAFAQAFDLTDQMKEDLDSNDESGKVYEGQVKIKLSKETKKRIRGPWSKAIIVKLVRKTVGLSYM